MHLKRKGWVSFGLSLVSLLLLAVFFAQKAHALSVSGEFVDAANIKITNIEITQSDVDNGRLSDDALDIIDKGGLQALNNLIDSQAQGTYFDREFDDSTREYVRSNNDCNSRIQNDGDEWRLVALHVRPATGGCTSELIKNEHDPSLNLAAISNLEIKFRWVNQNTMVRVDGRDGQFWEEDPENFQNYFFRVNEDGEDRDYVQLISGNTKGQYFVNGDSKGLVSIADANKRSNPATPPGTPADGSAGSEPESCESRGGVMGWIMCPVVNVLDGFFNWVDGQIQRLLLVDEDKFRDPNLEKTWGAIRNIAYIILVPVMLVMVIGTALGFEFISAYTVKKALPRLLIATLFITLSWEITGFLIEVSNSVGRGVLGLITSPLDIGGGSDGVTLQDLFSPSFGGTAIQGAAIAGIAVAAFTPGVLGIVFSFMGTAALIILAAFIVLIARQLFILGLMILAPVAIVSWIFPGNDKLWKFWWGTFSKLLIMFPLITGLIGVGRVFAYIVGHADSAGAEGAILNPMLKLVAYVIPYALIPLTFKFAGGLVGNLAGMVSDRNKGLFDRLRQGRQPKYERAGRGVLQKRANLVRGLDDKASGSRGFKRVATGFAANRLRGYNLEGAMSARTASVGKEVNDQIATGQDGAVRGLAAMHSYNEAKNNRWDGKTDTDYARVRDGKRQYKSLAGAWIDEANVLEGERRWGNDTFAQQAALSYEMRKAMTSDQVASVSEQYSNLANAWGMTGSQAGGAWIGAAFENQGQHIEYKNTDFAYEDGKIKGPGTLNAAKFANEVYEKKGSYPLAQMSGHTIEQLKAAYTADTDSYLPSGVTMDTASTEQIEKAQAVRDNTRGQVKEIAETFAFRSQGMEGDVPVSGRPSGVAGVSAPGAASVNKEVRELYTLVNPDRSAGNPPTEQAGPDNSQV
jgi:hypothetical protein